MQVGRVAEHLVLWASIAALQACCADRSPELGARVGVGSHTEPTPSTAGREPVVTPRLEGLLLHDPTPESLQYLTDDVLFMNSEEAFTSTMVALTTSKSQQVAMLGAEVLSAGYHLAAGRRPDVEVAIAASLGADSPHVRRIVVRNLSQLDSPLVRRWLLERAQDGELDRMEARSRSVAEEARNALARLDAAKANGLGLSLSDSFSWIDAPVGGAVRASIEGTSFELLVEIESMTTAVASTSMLRAPFFNGRFTIVGRGTDFEVTVLTLSDRPIYSGGWIRTPSALLYVWCRPVGRETVRCWYKVEIYPFATGGPARVEQR
jgi:hypothetical protein